MTIPDYQTLMLPLLKAVGDKKVHQIRDLYKVLSDEFKLSEDEREKRLPSGRETYIKNRISWARTYLRKAGLVSSPAKGQVKITTKGIEVLDSNISKIDNRYLRKFEGFVKFRPRSSDKVSKIRKQEPNHETTAAEDDSRSTPEENIDSAYLALRDALVSDLIEEIKRSGPYFFERLVIDLMLGMGYGGSREDAGQATQATNDDGIDGIINEDKLGLDTIYLQAKRWNKTIHRPEIDKFIGALTRKRAKKGVLITTSKFSDGALSAAQDLDMNLVLIDGQRLAELMVEYNIGVSTREIYEIKNIDFDYFDGE